MNPSIDFSSLPLRDIHLPDPVSWWPPAPGWWLVLAAVAAGLGYAAWRHYRYRAHRVALRAIAGISAELGRGGEPIRCLQALSVVLRRFAITAAGDAREHGVPGMVGRRWLEYLEARSREGGFEHGVGRMLLDAPYAPAHRVSPQQALALARLCGDWVKAQRPGG